MSFSGATEKYQNKTLSWEVVGLIAILIFEVIFTYNRVLYGIDLAHISLPADGAYRIYSGQVPSRDFHTPAGFTLFYTLAGFFYLLGGFSFKAVALYSAVIGAIGTIAVYYILRLYTGSIAALVFAGISSMTLCMPRAHPWKDEPAILFYILSLTAFSFAYRYKDRFSSVKISCLSALSGLSMTASIFSKHNIGLTAFTVTAPLWLLLSSEKNDKLISRVKVFLICLFSTIFSTLLLIAYFESNGSFFSDITQSAGMLHRLSVLLPNAAMKEWLLRDWGRIVFIVYVTAATLIAGFVYVLRLSLKELLRERVLIFSIISLITVSYFGHLTSESGALPAFELFALLLGLLYSMLSKFKEMSDYSKVDSKRLSNFCIVTGAIALSTFLLWFATYLTDFADIVKLKGATTPGRTKVADIPFLAIMLTVAIMLLAAGFIYQKDKEKPLHSLKNIFIGAKIFVILIAVSPILYFEYAGSPYKTAVTRLMMPVLKNTGLVKSVEFKDIPVLDGVYADPKMVNEIEKLVRWFRPKIEADPSLKNGTGIYVFPHGTSLYGILGVESFRNVYLWLSYKLTFNQLDPDTDEIIRESPKFIIMYPYTNTDDPSKSLLLMPRLQKILKEDYNLAVQFGDFFIYRKA
ncbi:MAG: glycosyltransferase family 39 protein [Candidatus Omnitrophica bacterium]|nr:glycosyltransferase family 39 protein [Candidatus Omnitrophota bacterium]